MKAFRSDREHRASAGGTIAGLFVWLALTACTLFEPAPGWVRAGTDEATTAREANNCRAQANTVLGNEHAINQDISATLGGNWQRARTAGVVDQSLRHQAANYAGQIFDSCMRAKGFKKAK